ncbi:hypothetical protein ACVIGB_000609 [Bradyrhizobium sp. USDA 4341]
MKHLLSIDLRGPTLDLCEPGLRVIDDATGEHVASILPDQNGRYDAHAGRELSFMINQRFPSIARP